MKFAPYYSLALLLALNCVPFSKAQEKEEKEAPRAEAAPAAKPAREEPADLLDAQAMQYEQMLLPKMWRELDFVKETCDLTREQRPKIKAAALGSVKKGAKEFTRQMQQGNQNDPMLTIRKDLRKSLETILTKEQLASYQAAGERRSDAHKKATLRIVVAELDSLLYLDRDQRDKIMQTLDKKWQESWESWVVVGQYGGRYFPMIPDEHLTPHLNQQQKTVWQGIQKINLGFRGGGGRVGGDTDWWDGKEEAEKTKAENQ